MAAPILALLILGLACSRNPASEDVTPHSVEGSDPPAPGEAPWSDVAGGWTELDQPPEILESSVQVWTGDELILWGGNQGDEQDHSGEGYVFHASGQKWRSIATSPLSPRSFSAGVWTGSELLIWGGSNGSGGQGELDDGAAYDPETDLWRSIAPSPISPNGPMLAEWTGTEMVVWGTRRADGTGTGAAYDPSTDTWRTIPDPPIALNDVHAAWTGSEIIAFGANLRGGNHADTDVAVGAAYDPSLDTWRAIAASELSPQYSQVTWDGRRLVVVDTDMKAAAYAPATDAWTRLPSLPTDQNAKVASVRSCTLLTRC